MKNYIVVSTCSRLVRQVLMAIRSMSVNSNIVVIGNEKTRNLRWTGFNVENKVVGFEHQNQHAIANLINGAAMKMSNAVLIPTDCDAARLINRIRSEINVHVIPMANPDTMEMLDNKWNFYKFCVQQNIRVPETIYVGSKENLDFQNITGRLGLPFILKPVNQAGSNGVHVIDSERYFTESILADPEYNFDTLIAQKYIAGYDLCFNFMALQGRIHALSIQRRIGPEIRFLDNPQLEELGFHLARASEYSGVMCVDARVDEKTEKIYLIESNPRFWASLCASVWCGMNFVQEILEPGIQGQETPRRLTSGIYYERHPIYKPSSWPALFVDSSGQGQIFRDMMCDLPTISDLARSLPLTFGKLMKVRRPARQETRSYQ